MTTLHCHNTDPLNDSGPCIRPYNHTGNCLDSSDHCFYPG